MAEVTYLEALRQGLWEEMERDPSVFILGEDVGAYGGAFKVTEGFAKKFGEARVIDTPISEAAIVGAAAGAAHMGMRLVYPDSLRRRGIRGNVVLEFVVDTLGRVEPGVRVLHTAHPLLAEPAKEMIRGARYAPGRVHGRAVRVVVRMGLKVGPRSP